MKIKMTTMADELWSPPDLATQVSISLAKTHIGTKHVVSTVRLGFFMGLPFESMIFCLHHPDKCEWDGTQERYSTEGDAIRGHMIMCNNLTTND